MSASANRAGLLIVDVQNDFCSGGTLAVPDAGRAVTALNRYIRDAVAHGLIIYASRDWHPPKSKHFQPFGGPWPVHCVQETVGARFHPLIELPTSTVVITKGEDAASAGYSSFEGHTPEGHTFLADLQARGIDQLYVGGLATDFCVKHSVIDALSAGLKVTVLEDAVAGVSASGSRSAMREMRRLGARVRSGPELGRSACGERAFAAGGSSE
jgi:nicotinamidase/pyrazinamidase